MAPRGRRGKGKSRMDAAINDVVRRIGCPKELVRSKLTNLLKVYGKDGFPFIEEDGYKVLIDAIRSPEEEGKQGDLKYSDQETAVKHDSDEHKVNGVSISDSAEASEGGTATGYEMPSSAFQSDKDEGCCGKTIVGDCREDLPLHHVGSDQSSVVSLQEGQDRSSKRQKTCWWIKDGEDYKPPVIVYSPGKPIIPAELIELYRNHAKEAASGVALQPAPSVAGISDCQEPASSKDIDKHGD